MDAAKGKGPMARSEVRRRRGWAAVWVPVAEVLAGLSALVTIWVFVERWGPEPPAAAPSGDGMVICEVVVRGPGRDPAGEEIVLCNEGSAAVDLGGWRLEDNAGGYDVPRGTFVGAGERWAVGGVTFNPRGDTRGLHLNDGGDFVRLRAPDGLIVDTCSWPPKTPTGVCRKTWL